MSKGPFIVQLPPTPIYPIYYVLVTARCGVTPCGRPVAVGNAQPLKSALSVRPSAVEIGINCLPRPRPFVRHGLPCDACAVLGGEGSRGADAIRAFNS